LQTALGLSASWCALRLDFKVLRDEIMVFPWN
jgi:hypothetical protein